MKIGIVSDSHGHDDRLAIAVEKLLALGAEALVHCGDLGDENCLRVLGAAPVPAYAVGGNIDRQVRKLVRVAAESGVEFHSEIIEVPLGDGRFLVAMHGHDEQLVNELLVGQQFPYLCHGHTHRRRDERIGKMRVINPGALHRAEPHTMAILDTDKDVVAFIVVDD